MLNDRVSAGCTLIMTTHILEVANAWRRIGVISLGTAFGRRYPAEYEENGHNDNSSKDLFIALSRPPLHELSRRLEVVWPGTNSTGVAVNG